MYSVLHRLTTIFYTDIFCKTIFGVTRDVVAKLQFFIHFLCAPEFRVLDKFKTFVYYCLLDLNHEHHALDFLACLLSFWARKKGENLAQKFEKSPKKGSAKSQKISCQDSCKNQLTLVKPDRPSLRMLLELGYQISPKLRCALCWYFNYFITVCLKVVVTF